MRKIRFKEIDRFKYEIILPENDENPIGCVQQDIFKNRNSWYIKPYFVTLYKDTKIINVGYEDFAIAGRALADIWEYTMTLFRDEKTEELYIADLFKNLSP